MVVPQTFVNLKYLFVKSQILQKNKFSLASGFATSTFFDAFKLGCENWNFVCVKKLVVFLEFFPFVHFFGFVCVNIFLLFPVQRQMGFSFVFSSFFNFLCQDNQKCLPWHKLSKKHIAVTNFSFYRYIIGKSLLDSKIKTSVHFIFKNKTIIDLKCTQYTRIAARCSKYSFK